MASNQFFDEVKWQIAITGRSDWYNVIYPEFNEILARYEVSDLATRKASRNAVYGFIEALLAEKRVVLGTAGKDWDSERKPIDTVVIHHTKVESGITWPRLDAMHLLRLYAKAYFSPSTEKEIKGMPVFSHHFRDDGRMIFYAYHWLVRTDGTSERLLHDNEIGWQAGNWDINCRSVGICLDGDFEHSAPRKAMIEGVKKIIRDNYKDVDLVRIIPHREANPETTCPGGWYKSVVWW